MQMMAAILCKCSHLMQMQMQPYSANDGSHTMQEAEVGVRGKIRWVLQAIRCKLQRVC